MSSKDALKYLLPGAVPYAMTKAAINAVKGKKKDAAKRPKPSKVAPKPSSPSKPSNPKPSRSPKATGHPSRKNKGAASERTGSNASKANTGRGNWI